MVHTQMSPLEAELIDRSHQRYTQVIKDNPELEIVDYLDFLLERNPHNQHTLYEAMQTASKSLPDNYPEKKRRELIDTNSKVQYETRMLQGYASLQNIARAVNPLAIKHLNQASEPMQKKDAKLGEILTSLYAPLITSAIANAGR